MGSLVSTTGVGSAIAPRASIAFGAAADDVVHQGVKPRRNVSNNPTHMSPLVGSGPVQSRGQMPAKPATQESVVAKVIIDVVDRDIEHHPPEEFSRVLRVFAFSLDHVRNLGVAAPIAVSKLQ